LLPLEGSVNFADVVSMNTETAPGSRAVFLSYASQDAEAARRIAVALRASGVEVWFDQNEIVDGDAWDAKIRRQIASCAPPSRRKQVLAARWSRPLLRERAWRGESHNFQR
jgi:hypothetical protein